MSLIEAFEVIDSGQAALRRNLISGIPVIGGRFDVYARFRRDPQSDYRKLEFRQYIRGVTTVNGQPMDLIRVAIPGGGTRPIHQSQYYEDGDPTLGANGFYGHRSNQAADEDYYYNRDPATQNETRDMLGGSHYISFDIYGIRLPPDRVRALRGLTIYLNLEFKLQIARCEQPGGRPVEFFSNAVRHLRKNALVTLS